jgi:phosphoribosylformylglycinamidine synthase subunit PurQ / glutaminase
VTRVGVVTFPGSLDDRDAARAVRLAGGYPVNLWHADRELHGVEAIILPGGFSYGDYLRCGAIARFAPVMEAVVRAAGAGMPVLGICNGFQVLCEVHLLPGALVRNAHLHFRNRDQWLRIESTDTPWTAGFTAGQEIIVPVKSGEGCYVADTRTLDELEADGRVVARYCAGPPTSTGELAAAVRYRDGHSPNGSLRDIAAIANEAGNVVGIMPHPEHAVEALTGPSVDGLGFFTSILKHLVGAPAGAHSAGVPVTGVSV